MYSQAARIIRNVVTGEANQGKFVLVVEHDLAVLDYLSGTCSINLIIQSMACLLLLHAMCLFWLL
jgi:translation initiation factor RLI1